MNRGGCRGRAMYRGGKTQAQPRADSNREDYRKARHKEDLNDRLKVILEDEGMEYGDSSTDDDTIVSRFRTALELRTKRIDQVFREIRRARNVELCFLVDITGSMQPHIDGVRTSIKQIVQNLTSNQAGAHGVAAQEMKLAFMGYRDFGEPKQFEMLQFCSSPPLLETFCQSLVAKTSVKGGDFPEDVFGGLENALKLNWTPNAGTKVLFHICDAPCHGDEFHVGQSVKDNYPTGDPQGRTHTDLFRQIKEKGIQYYFGKITKYTDIMIKKFSEAYGEPIVDFDVKKIEMIKDSVIAAVNKSILSSITTSMRTTGVVRKERPFTLDPAEPNWVHCKIFKGKITSYKLPDCIRDIIDDVPLDKVKSIPADIQVAGMPFAHGAERLAFYGRDVTAFLDAYAKEEADRTTEKKKNDDIVLKEYRHTGKGMNSAKRYELSNQLQTIASYLAFEFRKAVKKRTGEDVKVKFLKIRTLALTEEPVRFMLVERRFAPTDKFIRFSNNVTYEIVEEKAKALGISLGFVHLVTAFSHWTHQVTDGYLMVVDLEGIVSMSQTGGPPAVILTDPAIHCKDKTRFGQMNHGRKGMDNFFQGHRCNDWCRRMSLSVSNSE